MSQNAVSYFSKHGEDPTAHHPTKGMDGHSDTCYVSGYHTAAWWEVKFAKKYDITGVDFYGNGIVMLVRLGFHGNNIVRKSFKVIQI